MEQYFTAMVDEEGHDAVASQESAFMASDQTTDVTLGHPSAYGPIPILIVLAERAYAAVM